MPVLSKAFTITQRENLSIDILSFLSILSHLFVRSLKSSASRTFFLYIYYHRTLLHYFLPLGLDGLETVAVFMKNLRTGLGSVVKRLFERRVRYLDLLPFLSFLSFLSYLSV